MKLARQVDEKAKKCKKKTAYNCQEMDKILLKSQKYFPGRLMKLARQSDESGQAG